MESLEGKEMKAATKLKKKKRKIFPNSAFKSDPNGFILIQILADSTYQKRGRWLNSAAGITWKENRSCGCLNRLFTAKIPTVPSHCHETVLVPLFETSIWAFQMADFPVGESRSVLDNSVPVVDVQPRRFPVC